VYGGRRGEEWLSVGGMAWEEVGEHAVSAGTLATDQTATATTVGSMTSGEDREA